ncbi:MAG: hypothetical protein V1817_04430, partial [Candidatus Micrarchaeota archaeon]
MVSHKDVLMLVVGVVLVAFAFANFAGASTLSVSYSSISLYASRTANVFVYVSNPSAESQIVSFSASSASGVVSTSFNYYDARIVPRGSRGATLRITAPEIMRGCDTVTVTATVCSADGSGACETLSRDIRVYIRPSVDSRYYADSPADYCANYYAPSTTPAGRFVRSRIELTGYFDPTAYEARFVDAYGVSACKTIRPGEVARFPVSLRNTGAATSYNIRLMGDKDVLNAGVSSSYVSLERNEIAEIVVRVAPLHSASGGRYYAVVQAQRNGVVVAEKEVCVEIEHSYGVRLNAPSVVEASTCGVNGFEVELENTGTGRDIYALDVSEPDWALVATRNIEARAGEKQVFEVKIDGTRLQPGVYRLGLKATSGENVYSREVSDKDFVEVRVASCTPKTPLAPPQTSVSKQTQDETVKLLVNIENPSNEPIDNVSVALDGLPENWTYVTESGFVLPPQSNRTLTVLIKRTTDEEATGVVLKIKSGEKVVGVQDIAKIESRASGLTGFFVAAGSNTWIIALIIVVALAVVVLSGRLRSGKEDEQS